MGLGISITTTKPKKKAPPAASIRPDFLRKPVASVLSHDKKILPFIDQMIRHRRQQAQNQTQQQAPTGLFGFGGGELATGGAAGAGDSAVNQMFANLPFGEIEPAFFTMMNQATLQELQMLQSFAILGPDDKIYLLEHPNLVDKVMGGGMVLEAEGIREMIAESLQVDPSVNKFMEACKCLMHVEGIKSCACNDEERTDHFHPTDTPLTAVVLEHAQNFSMAHDHHDPKSEA